MPTKIEWAEETWNPVTGCTPISEGCANCYARRMAKRLAGRYGYPAYDPFKVTVHPGRLNDPLRWRKPRMIFVCSMGDLFHPDVPFEFIDRVFAVMFCNPQHTFLVLTKRPENVQVYFTNLLKDSYNPKRVLIKDEIGWGNYWVPWPLPNLWLGVTAENQARADERIPILLQIPAAVRFVSVEPMLGPVDLSACKPFDGECYCQEEPDGCKPRLANGCPEAAIDWVIVGGETGPGARPMHPDWVRSLVLQCKNAGVPIFVKQMGSVWAKAHSSDRASNRPEEWPEDLRIRELPPSRNCSLTP